jgi:hypothetical protein
MSLKIEHLDEQGYQLQAVLQHEELVPFIQDIFKKPNVITRLFILLNIALLAWLLGWMVYEMVAQDRSFGWVLIQLGLGVLLILPVIPLHEWLHGMAYKLLGAQKVNYTANFKKFYFTAQAHHFIVREKGFYWLAFTPFVMINSMIIVLMFVLPVSYLLLLISFLLMHTTACGGDFALAAYFYSRRNTGLITYDDVPAKKTYFYTPVFE